jgi:LmbE family N-acetylglucosaminyl deacetylase
MGVILELEKFPDKEPALNPKTFERMAVISPHLDDGVFSCGDLLASHPGAAVVTVFAGGPSSSTDIKPWDAAAGFHPGDNVMAARRAEDQTA